MRCDRLDHEARSAVDGTVDAQQRVSTVGLSEHGGGHPGFRLGSCCESRLESRFGFSTGSRFRSSSGSGRIPVQHGSDLEDQGCTARASGRRLLPWGPLWLPRDARPKGPPAFVVGHSLVLDVVQELLCLDALGEQQPRRGAWSWRCSGRWPRRVSGPPVSERSDDTLVLAHRLALQLALQLAVQVALQLASGLAVQLASTRRRPRFSRGAELGGQGAAAVLRRADYFCTAPLRLVDVRSRTSGRAPGRGSGRASGAVSGRASGRASPRAAVPHPALRPARSARSPATSHADYFPTDPPPGGRPCEVVSPAAAGPSTSSCSWSCSPSWRSSFWTFWTAPSRARAKTNGPTRARGPRAYWGQ